MAPPVDDVATRILGLSGAALRLIAEKRNQHFSTLRDATFRNRRSLPTSLVKQLNDLNTAATVLRHYTDPWANDFLTRLASSLESIDDGNVEAKVDVEEKSDETTADYDGGSEKASGNEGALDEGAPFSHLQLHDEVCHHGHERCIGDAVDMSVQTKHTGENTVILCGPEEVVDEIVKEAVKALIDEVGRVHGKFEDIESEPLGDESWGEGLGEGVAEMVFEEGFDERFKESTCHAYLCLVRLHFAALEFLELTAEVGFYAGMECSWPMLAEDAESHNKFHAAACNAIDIFGDFEPFVADLTACTALEVLDAMLDLAFRDGYTRQKASELADEFVGRGASKPLVELVIAYSSGPF